MTIVTSGVTSDGKPCTFYLDDNLKRNLDEIKSVVGTGGKSGKDWDEVAIISGYPGTGKSQLTQLMAKYCCSWFDVNYIAFDADSFIEIINNCKPNSAVVLDESFQSMNSKTVMTSEFVRIINHLQLVRQRNCFIFLVCPDFFSLAKSIAIYRSSHLFVTYSQKYGSRGTFAAWSRENKKLLYIKGQKFINYHAQLSNFRGRFGKARVIDGDEYLKRKRAHLLSQGDKRETPTTGLKKAYATRDRLIFNLYVYENFSAKKIAEYCGMSEPGVHLCIKTIMNQMPSITDNDIKNKDTSELTSLVD